MQVYFHVCQRTAVEDNASICTEKKSVCRELGIALLRNREMCSLRAWGVTAQNKLKQLSVMGDRQQLEEPPLSCGHFRWTDRSYQSCHMKRETVTKGRKEIVHNMWIKCSEPKPIRNFLCPVSVSVRQKGSFREKLSKNK